MSILPAIALALVSAGLGYIVRGLIGGVRHDAWLAKRWDQLIQLNIRRGDPNPDDLDADRYSVNDLLSIFGEDR